MVAKTHTHAQEPEEGRDMQQAIKEIKEDIFELCRSAVNTGLTEADVLEAFRAAEKHEHEARAKREADERERDN